MDFMVVSPHDSNVIITGDLNSRRHPHERGGSSHPPFQKWLDQTGFTDKIGDHLAETNTTLPTYGQNGDMISRIDHALTLLTNIKLCSYGVSSSLIWQNISDHYQLIIKLQAPKLTQTTGGYHPKGFAHSFN